VIVILQQLLQQLHQLQQLALVQYQLQQLALVQYQLQQLLLLLQQLQLQLVHHLDVTQLHRFQLLKAVVVQ
jgi:hypothetical protein